MDIRTIGEAVTVTAIQVLSHDDFSSMGASHRRITAAVKTGALIRLRPGFYASGTTWTAATPEERINARADALQLRSKTAPVVSHETAAARHGLPLFRGREDRVHVIAPEGRPGAASGVIRHRGELGEEDVVEIDRMRCTSLPRTVADIARTGTFEQSVTVADAALRRIAVPKNGVYLVDAAEELRASVLSIIKRSSHGQTRAKRALAFADGRAQLPGESISRIRLVQLGFRRISLQVPIPGPNPRSMYHVDFGMDDADGFGEFDGAMKYVDGRLLDGRTTTEVFDAEKQREDWIRGRTQRRYVRWGWPHIENSDRLAERLAAFGIRPPTADR